MLVRNTQDRIEFPGPRAVWEGALDGRQPTVQAPARPALLGCRGLVQLVNRLLDCSLFCFAP